MMPYSYTHMATVGVKGLYLNNTFSYTCTLDTWPAAIAATNVNVCMILLPATEIFIAYDIRVRSKLVLLPYIFIIHE